MVGNFQEVLWQHVPSRTVAACAPVSEADHCRPMLPQETLKHSEAGLDQSPVDSLLLSPEFWCTQGFICALEASLFPLVLWKFCNQIPLAFKVRFPGDSQSFCWVPRLGSLRWVLFFFFDFFKNFILFLYFT